MNGQHAASVLFWKLELGNRKNRNVSLFGLCCNLDQFSFDFPSYLLNRNQSEVFRRKKQPQNENCWTRFSEIPTRFGAGNLHGMRPPRSVRFLNKAHHPQGMLVALSISAHTLAAVFPPSFLMASIPQTRLSSSALLQLLETSCGLSV